MSAPAMQRSVPAQTRSEPERLLLAETNRPEAQTPSTFLHEDIARLAYTIWQQRGSIEGSPERDWIEAEEQLRKASTQP